MKKLISIIILLLSIFYYYSQGISFMTNKKPTPQQVTLHMGKQGVHDFNIASGEDVNRQPAGMSFYHLNWQPNQLGEVTIEHANSQITIDNVFLITGVTSHNNKYGIFQNIVHSGLNKTQYVKKIDAYNAYKLFMEKINTSEWQVYYETYKARIAKTDNLKLILETSYASDPRMILTYEEWKQVFTKNYSNLYYTLYLDGVVMNITFRRTDFDDFDDFDDGKFQFMIETTFMTIRYKTNNMLPVSGLKGDAWHKTYQLAAKEEDEDRAMEEEKMKAKGYRIDESYVNPDIWEYMQ